MKILVLTISDRAARGEYEDLSGPAVEKILAGGIPGAETERLVVPDEPADIERILRAPRGIDVIITTGGTGLGPRDCTPEITRRLCDRLVPGIAEYLRLKSLDETIHAVTSRGTAAVRGTTLIVNLPGSVEGASFCAELLLPILPHAVRMIRGEGH